MAKQFQINLALIHIYPCDLHGDHISQPKRFLASLPKEALLTPVKLVVITHQCADMHEPLNQDSLQLNKETELSDSRNSSIEIVADVITEVITFNPIEHFINSIIRPPLSKRRMFTLQNDGILFIGIEVDFTGLSESSNLITVER